MSALPKMGFLKLRAEDGEDIQIISAILQDAIVPLCDIAYQPIDKNFVMVTQRLRREQGEKGSERICCAVTIKGVKSVQSRGFDPKVQDRMLDMLALMLEGQSLNLIFAGDARIRLELENWALAAEDFGEPWPALCNPCHDDTPKPL